MREIKFRGKTVDTKRWKFGSYHAPSNEACKPLIYEHFSKPTRDGNGYWYEVEADTVGQFTGRCVSESAEIFEGDILEYTVFDYQGGDTQYRGVVEWCGSRFIVSVCLVSTSNTWREKRDYEESYYDLDWLLDQDDEVKIIGNIHDNPELLKGD